MNIKVAAFTVSEKSINTFVVMVFIWESFSLNSFFKPSISLVSLDIEESYKKEI